MITGKQGSWSTGSIYELVMLKNLILKKSSYLKEHWAGLFADCAVIDCIIADIQKPWHEQLSERVEVVESVEEALRSDLS